MIWGNMKQLIISSRHGDIQAVRELLNKGSDINTFDSFGYTALMAAAMRGHTHVMKLLLEQGAKLEMQDKGTGKESSPKGKTVYHSGRTVLILACMARQPESAKLLLEHGANINAQDDNGRTALMWVCSGESSFMEELAHAMANDDSVWRAALEKENELFSLEARRLLVAEVLLESRPKLDITDKEGHTALDFALQNGNKALVRALELYGEKDARR